MRKIGKMVSGAAVLLMLAAAWACSPYRPVYYTSNVEFLLPEE